MKKEGFILFVFIFVAILISSNIVFAAVNDSAEEKAYSCIKNKTDGKTSSLSLEQIQFSLLALAYDSSLQSQLESALNSKKSSSNCWPSSCNVKDTAISIIALNYIGEDTSSSEDWLLSKKILTKNLNFYLEVDMANKGNCTINYGGSNYKVNVDENKKLSGSLGSCLTLDNNNYWMKIADSCLNKNFSVSCNLDFISTLLYKKSSSDVWYVSDEVLSSTANGVTQHNISSYCFSNNGQDCDYESSLWATLALQKTSYDITNFLPYLIAFSGDNPKYFPDTFLYFLTDSADYLNEIVSLQKSEGYWDLSSSQGKFYDSALAMLVLSSASPDASNSAKSWLQEKQATDGCWNNNLRDTAFLLYAGWPKTPSASHTTTTSDCEENNNYCISEAACEDANGDVLEDFSGCGIDICCSVDERQQNCSEMSKLSGYTGNGEICSEDKVCSITTISSEDSLDCCLGDCEEPTALTPCEEHEYTCKDECGDREVTANYDCSDEAVCCKEKESGGIPAIVWILLILIILVVLAIIFRNRLKIILFKKKNDVREGAVSKSRPPFFPPASAPMRQMPARQIPPQLRTISTTPQKLPTKRDKEFEETMKKLKDISK